MDQVATDATDAADTSAATAIEIGLEAAASRAPGGVTIRTFRDETDFEAMAAARNAAAIADSRRLVIDANRVASDLAVMNLDPATALLLAEVDGSVVGWIRIRDEGIDPDVGRVLDHTGCVDPAHRRRGIGAALLAGGQAALRSRLAAGPAGRRRPRALQRPRRLGGHRRAGDVRA